LTSEIRSRIDYFLPGDIIIVLNCKHIELTKK